MTMLFTSVLTTIDMVSICDYICDINFNKYGYSQPGRLLEILKQDSNCNHIKGTEWYIISTAQIPGDNTAMTMTISNGFDLGIILFRSHF